MADSSVYKILFFMQSAVFIIFLMSFSQLSNVIYTPAKLPHVNKCEGIGIRKALDAFTVSIEETCGNLSNCALAKNFTRGPLSNCSVLDIMKRPGVMMMTTTTHGFLDITLNMLESIKRVGLCVNTTIIAEDQRVYKYLHKRAEGDPGVHVVMTSTGEIDSQLVKAKHLNPYFELLKKRQLYFLALLEQGLEVLFSDCDTFWFRDPFAYFQGDFDMSMVDSRSPYPLRSPKGDFCAGFIYLKPTNATLQFVKGWIEYLKGKVLMDQVAMNRLLKLDQPVHVNIKPLDPNIFPWGPKYYELLEKKANYSTAVMHAASIRGHAAKVKKFKSSHMWLVNATSEEMLASSMY